MSQADSTQRKVIHQVNRQKEGTAIRVFSVTGVWQNASYTFGTEAKDKNLIYFISSAIQLNP